MEKTLIGKVEELKKQLKEEQKKSESLSVLVKSLDSVNRGFMLEKMEKRARKRYRLAKLKKALMVVHSLLWVFVFLPLDLALLLGECDDLGTFFMIKLLGVVLTIALVILYPLGLRYGLLYDVKKLFPKQ